METLHKRCVALALSEMESTDDLEIVERCNSDYDDNLVFRVMMILWWMNHRIILIQMKMRVSIHLIAISSSNNEYLLKLWVARKWISK